MVEGVLEAPNIDSFIKQAIQKNIHLLWFYPQFFLLFRKLSFQDSLSLCMNLEYLLKAGLSLPQSLSHIQRVSSSRLKSVCADLHQKIEGGFSLSDAFQSNKRYFDPIFVEIIKVGESHGSLSQSFQQIRTYLIWKNTFQKSILQAIRYPMILFCFLIGLIVSLTIFLVPPLKSFLATTSMGTQSFATQTLLGFTDFFESYGLLFGISLLLAMIGGYFLVKLPALKIKWHTFILRLPFMGSFLIKVWVIKASMNLCLLLQSNVFLLNALEVAISQTSNMALKNSLERLKHNIERGQSLSSGLESISFFPPLLAQFIKAGENSNNLADSFLTIRDYYSETVQHQIDFLKDALPTVGLLAIGGFLMWIVQGLFYPLYSLTGF